MLQKGAAFVHKPIRLSPFQTGFLAIGSALASIVDPSRADMVAALGDTTGSPALVRLRTQMLSSKSGRKILEEKPIIRQPKVVLEDLRTLPKTTFGWAYADWMISRGFSNEERPIVRFVQDEELAYIMQRYRECHDFWHVLAGMPTSIVSEVAVKWLELLQTGLPVCALSAFVGPLRLNCKDIRLLTVHMLPWAIHCARNSVPLLTVYYEQHFEDDLEDFRRKLNFTPYTGPLEL